MAKVFVITGPSGVGKGTLIRTLLGRMPELELAVSATTRRPRPGEAHGVDYHFLSDDEFERRVREGEFVEHAHYSGRRYGTLRSELEQRLAGGHPVVLEIEELLAVLDAHAGQPAGSDRWAVGAASSNGGLARDGRGRTARARSTHPRAGR